MPLAMHRHARVATDPKAQIAVRPRAANPRRRRLPARVLPLLLALPVPVLLLLLSPRGAAAQQSQDPQLLNGGSVLAMAGDGCVALAVDRRFGSGPQVVNVGPRTVLAPTPRLLVAFTGLEGDVQSLADELSAQVAAKVGRSSGFGFGGKEGGDGGGAGAIGPRSMAALTSHVLYGRRRAPYYVEPIVAGLERVVVEEGEGGEGESEVGGNEGDGDGDGASNDDEGGADSDAQGRRRGRSSPRRVVRHRPYLCAQDIIGAQSTSHAFVCSGAASKSMYGIAEAMWTPGLRPDELARVCGRAFLSALERDCLSGYGATLYIVSQDGIVEYDLACRND